MMNIGGKTLFTFQFQQILLCCLIISSRIQFKMANLSINNVCDIEIKLDEFSSDIMSTNTMLSNNIVNYSLVNATSVQDCIKSCCSKINCNLAFYKDSSICFLISCLTDDSCQPIENKMKSNQDPIDFLVKVRTFEETTLALETILEDKSNKCSTKCEHDEKCLFRDQTQTFECRQFLEASQNCEMYLGEECNLNQECVTLNEYAKHGTCQCKIGFARNANTMKCQELNLKEDFDTKTPTAPPKKDQLELEKNDESSSSSSFWQKFLNELGIKNMKEQIISKTTLPQDVSPTNTTTSTTTPTPTDAPDLFSDDIIANAGPDIHIYYPSKICVLNGTTSKISKKGEWIVKWLWTKMDSSPAFGNFIGSSESSPIAVYENLQVGFYRFLLQIWTNENSFSQDTVHVYIHSLTDKDNKNHLDLAQNLIKIQLDSSNPTDFDETKKKSFLNKLENLIQKQDFKLKSPKVMLISTKVLTKPGKTSQVEIEFVIVENNDLAKSVDDDQINLESKLVKSSYMIPLLRKIQKEALFLSGDISQATCNTERYSRGFNCSFHGKCDVYSHECVCDKYWMPNLYMFYFDKQHDLTNGNNCEWNIPLAMAISSVLLTICLLCVFYMIKYIFYYLCCCCCCQYFCRSNAKLKGGKSKSSYKKLTNYHDDENDDEDEDYHTDNYENENLMKRTSFDKTKLSKRTMRNVPNSNGKSQKYSLLKNDDSLSDFKSSPKNALGSQLNYDEDENVVFDQKLSPTYNKKTNDEKLMKKYNII